MIAHAKATGGIDYKLMNTTNHADVESIVITNGHHFYFGAFASSFSEYKINAGASFQKA